MSAVRDTTVYLIYSQVTPISGCRLHTQPEDAPCRYDRDPFNVDEIKGVKDVDLCPSVV